MQTEIRFDQEVAMVTGAGSGLGRAYALKLASRGAKIVVNDLRGAASVVAEIEAAGGVALASANSVIDGAEAMVQAAVARFGRLDIVINNAGILGGYIPFPEMDDQEWRTILDTHMTGTMAVGRAAWPHLARSGKGRLVNISSTGAFGLEAHSHYSAAKGGIFSLSRSQALEGVRDGIRVACLMPTAHTPMTDTNPDAAFRAFYRDTFSPERVANFVAYLVHRDTTLSGCFAVAGGRVAPVFLAEAPGLFTGSDTPEAWIGREAELTAPDRLASPASTAEELAFRMQQMPAEIQGAYRALDWSKLASGG